MSQEFKRFKTKNSWLNDLLPNYIEPSKIGTKSNSGKPNSEKECYSNQT
jgi:hypothetical protein